MSGLFHVEFDTQCASMNWYTVGYTRFARDSVAAQLSD